MKIFFWDFCETDDCIRQWIFFIITWLIFCFTIYSVINTYRFYKRITIEMLPLTVNCLATALIISLQMFQRGFEYHLVTYLIEIYTYFLFCFTFITMYINANNISEKISRVLNIIFLVFSLFIVVLVTIVFLKAIIPSCQNVFTIQFYLFFITECILYFLTLAFGILIFRALRNTEKIQRNLRNLKGESIRDVLLEDQYFKEKIKQILIIQISYTITIALRIISIILNNIFSQQIHCTYIDQAYVQGSDQTLGKVLIIINNIIQLVPHLLLPIAVYIIPSTRRMNTLLILEEQDKQQNQLGSINFKKQQLLKKNISSLVLSNDNSNN